MSHHLRFLITINKFCCFFVSSDGAEQQRSSGFLQSTCIQSFSKMSLFNFQTLPVHHPPAVTPHPTIQVVPLSDVLDMVNAHQQRRLDPRRSDVGWVIVRIVFFIVFFFVILPWVLPVAFDVLYVFITGGRDGGSEQEQEHGCLSSRRRKKEFDAKDVIDMQFDLLRRVKVLPLRAVEVPKDAHAPEVAEVEASSEVAEGDRL
jgi:hypothetical protein